MENLNIPIYRAKKIDSDEYVEGVGVADNLLIQCILESYYDEYTASVVEIDPTTLSISFPDMLDSQGNKIFASLDRYYIKGADILENSNFLGDYSLQVAIYSEGCFYAQDKDGEQYNLCENWEKLKVIGIQE